MITVMDDVLMDLLSRRWYLFLHRPKDGSGGDGHNATLHSSCKERKILLFEHKLFMVSPAPYMGLSTKGLSTVKHSNMKHMVDMGVGKRTRVIIGTVGVIES